MSTVAPVGVTRWVGDVDLCGCGHSARAHLPACLATIHRTENDWGGGTTWLCDCPNFGSPAGITAGRRTRRFLVRLSTLGLAGEPR